MNTNKKIPKIKKLLPFIAVIISFLCFVGMCICIYFNGYFRDEYVPNIVNIPDIITYGMWILLIGLILSIVAVIVSKITLSKSLKQICVIYWTVLVLITCSFFVYAYHMQKLYPINGKSHISNEIHKQKFQEISLDKLKSYTTSKKTNLVYIGRMDCTACKEFENILSTYIKQIPTYYTNKDRDSERSTEMYALLEKLKISEVPSLILLKEKQVLKTFTLANEKEMINYLTTTYKP